MTRWRTLLGCKCTWCHEGLQLCVGISISIVQGLVLNKDVEVDVAVEVVDVAAKSVTQTFR